MRLSSIALKVTACCVAMTLTTLVIPGCGDDSGVGQEKTCDDGLDNDGDGQIDCADSDCLTAEVCDASEIDCGDEFDNDGDGDIDCDDSDCAGDAACVETACDDGLDNDGDGQTDCADSDCLGTAACGESDCDDGSDNDNDGDIDCDDSDCEGDPACIETNCTDQLDNDGDGDTDCADSDCEVETVCGATEFDCTDGFDNDGDGDIDCDDSECADLESCNMNCLEVLGCAQDCGTDLACVQGCSAGACPSGETAWNGLSNCMINSCGMACMNGVDSPACLDCINTHCSTQMNECITNTCEEPGETDCVDGVDNDSDGDTDCADSDCAAEPVCGGSGETCGELLLCAQNCAADVTCMAACRDNGCLSAQAAYDDVTACMSGNCLSECILSPTGTCEDCLATNCMQELAECVSDTCQSGGETECNDGQDNDGDSATDCDDPDCSADPRCSASTEINCDDSVDNDGDSLVDCNDTDDCADHVDCGGVGWNCLAIQTCAAECGTDMTCATDCRAGGCADAQDAFDDVATCSYSNCLTDCITDPQSTACTTCTANNCGTELTACGANTCS